MLLRPPSVDTAGAISTETGGGGTLTRLPAERDGFVIGFTIEGEHEHLQWKSSVVCVDPITWMGIQAFSCPRRSRRFQILTDLQSPTARCCWHGSKTAAREGGGQRRRNAFDGERLAAGSVIYCRR